jgi:hypothetical protein
MNVWNTIQYMYGNKIKLMLYAFLLFVFIIVIIIIILFFIAWISYICIKYMKLKLCGQLNNNIMEYNAACKSVLNTYGDFRIKRVYVMRTPIDTRIDLFFNLVSLYHWNKCKPPVTYHIGLLFEVEVSKNVSKHIIVEKMNGIYVKTDYTITERFELIPIKFDKCKMHTINSLLESTQKRMGLFHFYNWSMNSHCQIFTYNILKSIKPKTKYKQYFNSTSASSKFSELFSEFTKHLTDLCVHISSYQYTFI